MKRYVVIGFDFRGYIVVGRVFEDLREAENYFIYLHARMFDKMVRNESSKLDDADIFEMGYIPIKLRRSISD